jgi:hypothetical protein
LMHHFWCMPLMHHFWWLWCIRTVGAPTFEASFEASTWLLMRLL